MQKKSSNIVKIYYPEFNQKELIEKLKEGAKLISNILPLKLMILFGSYANGRYTAASDIDLLIVYNGLKREDDYSICWDILKIPQLELHIYTSSEYDKLKKSGSILIKEIEKKGIIIWKNL